MLRGCAVPRPVAPRTIGSREIMSRAVGRQDQYPSRQPPNDRMIAELTARLERARRRESRSLNVWIAAAAGIAMIIGAGAMAWGLSAPHPMFPASFEGF